MTDPVGELRGLDFSTVTPERFAAMVKAMSGEQLRAVFADVPLGERVLDEVFGRVGRQFRPEAAGSLRALVRWQITGAPGRRAVYETHIADGACTVRRGGSDAEPRLAFTLRDADFLRLVSGNATPVALLLRRRVRVTGDLALAAALTRYFAIPRP
ncbi:SCP2 sterol-binding domain-containing protein [Streptomyces sp. NPDC050560]|uniref:SCP2 sterol-binding domain-containing protein n=1 Tax=Streptomyces sp. NPDC050560 TaxID=3365630 RepID=UPI003793B358